MKHTLPPNSNKVVQVGLASFMRIHLENYKPLRGLIRCNIIKLMLFELPRKPKKPPFLFYYYIIYIYNIFSFSRFIKLG
jgi:hypothetical protein